MAMTYLGAVIGATRRQRRLWLKSRMCRKREMKVRFTHGSNNSDKTGVEGKNNSKQKKR